MPLVCNRKHVILNRRLRFGVVKPPVVKSRIQKCFSATDINISPFDSVHSNEYISSFDRILSYIHSHLFSSSKAKCIM